MGESDEAPPDTAPPPGTGQPDRAQPGEVLSELEQATRAALASASPEQVLRTIVAALPPSDIMPGRPPADFDPERFHGRVQKVSVSMPEELSAAIRERTGPGGFSRYIAEAADKRLRGDLFNEYLDELDRTYGPVAHELIEQARREWPDFGE